MFFSLKKKKKVGWKKCLPRNQRSPEHSWQQSRKMENSMCVPDNTIMTIN